MSRHLLLTTILISAVVVAFFFVFAEKLWIELTCSVTVSSPLDYEFRAVRELKTEWSWLGDAYTLREGFYLDSKKMAHEILERSGETISTQVWSFDGFLEPPWPPEQVREVRSPKRARSATQKELEMLLPVVDAKDAFLRIYPGADYRPGSVLVSLWEPDLIWRAICAGDSLTMEQRGAPARGSGFCFFEGVVANKLEVRAKVRISYWDDSGYVRMVFGEAREDGDGIVIGRDGVAFRGTEESAGRLPGGVTEVQVIYVGTRLFLELDGQFEMKRLVEGPKRGRIGFQWSGADLEITRLSICAELDRDWLDRLGKE